MRNLHVSDLNLIVYSVCVEENTDLPTLLHGGNHSALVDVRRRIVKQAREAGFSLPQIGRAINRHHTSVLHLSRTV